MHFELDLRFARQKWELTVALPGSNVDASTLDALLDAFRSEYGRRYGEGALVAGATVELVGLRAIGVGATSKPRSLNAVRAEASRDRTGHPSRSRPVLVERGGVRASVAVHDADDLRPGDRVRGPALVDGHDTTVWIPPGATLDVDEQRSLVMEVV
jgi:N-methylhydantoinase A